MVDTNTAPVINSLSVTKNGTYTAPEGVDGYSPIIVDVVEQPWQPLQDGYSNFWFELTNDTLSPWLNFSAKTENAVIDWGDGSGEQALTTLTPTHTYAKTGRYVVKVKGVTGIAAQQTIPYNAYIQILKNVELNSEVTSLANNAFRACLNLQNIDVSTCALQNVGSSIFYSCTNLKRVIGKRINPKSTEYYLCTSLQNIPDLDNSTSIESSAFYFCISIDSITLPSTITSIGSSAFSICSSLVEIHCLSTAPPALGTNVFSSLPADFIIYVPVGYAETYKAASGWSTYSDHILEEGQVRNRAMLANFNDEPEDDKPEETR